MRWYRTDPVQEVGALLVTGAQADVRLAAALARRVTTLGALRVAHGLDWSVVFGAPLAGEADLVLPWLPDAIGLYTAATDWWFPVGSRLDVPERHRLAALQALADANGIAPPAIVLPRLVGEVATEVDLYPIGQSVRFRESILARVAQ
jgi:hypothetical protein